MKHSSGIHHITAITGNPQKCIDFYEGFLGQRTVKKTVNFDDPSSYHLYFADAFGKPGTLMTFFYWGFMPDSTRGKGEVSALSYGISKEAADFWKKRAQEFDIDITEEKNNIGEDILKLHDSDGIEINLVLTDDKPTVDFWEKGPIPREAMLMGFYGATMKVENTEDMDKIMETLGYERQKKENLTTRFITESDRAKFIDMVEAPNLPKATQGTGSVHHIAFRTKNIETQDELRLKIMKAGAAPTAPIDRFYFRSVYFHTPEDILFEIATEGPGFLIDEDKESLGENLVLPEKLEQYREKIEEGLVPVELPRKNFNK